MPNPGLDRPIRKVTLNLYEEDVIFLMKWHGSGWQGRIRDILHERLAKMIQANKSHPPRRLGDWE